MIRFKMKMEAVWVGGERKEFDETEIGSFAEEERKGVRFLVAPISPFDIRDFLEKNTKKKELEIETVDKLAKTIKENFGGEGSQIKEFAGAFGVIQEMSNKKEVDWINYNSDIICKIIIKWEGIVDENDNPIECDNENKREIFLAYPALNRALLDISSTIRSNWQDFQKDKDESEEKNSENTLNGKSEEEKI